ncbi:uncharacterized protein ACRADG_004759 [Cochliomyia hominivorax]
MFSLRSFLIYSILIVLNVNAENVENDEIEAELKTEVPYELAEENPVAKLKSTMEFATQTKSEPSVLSKLEDLAVTEKELEVINPIVTPLHPHKTGNTHEIVEESEMFVDEFAKESEDEEIQLPSSVDEDVSSNDKSDLGTCLICFSIDDKNCHSNPKIPGPCPPANETGDRGIHNGCFTLYEVAENNTIRGCLDALTEEGLKICISDEKYCHRCYTNNCNNKPITNQGNISTIEVYIVIFMNIFIIIMKKKI